MKKIGLLGGTFDPPHLGHLLMAEEARIQEGLSEVWWLPNKIPPHKNQTTTTEKRRIEMVEQMVRLSPSFVLCLEEMKREGPSYTADTLGNLQKNYPDVKFYFIMGADSYDSFHRWDRFQQLQQQISFIVVNRPGSVDAVVKPEDFREISFLNRVALNISSSEIRASRAANKWNQFMITEEVNQLIKEHHLYE